MVYLLRFTIQINQMWVNIPYMDPMGVVLKCQRLLGCDHVAVSLKRGCAFRMVWTGSAGKEFTGPTRVVLGRIFGDKRNANQ